VAPRRPARRQCAGGVRPAEAIAARRVAGRSGRTGTTSTEWGPGSKSAEIYSSVLYAKLTPEFRLPFPVTLYLGVGQLWNAFHKTLIVCHSVTSLSDAEKIDANSSSEITRYGCQELLLPVSFGLPMPWA